MAIELDTLITAKYWSGTTIYSGLEGGDLRGEIIDFERMKVEGINFKLPLVDRHNAFDFCSNSNFSILPLAC